MFSTVSRFPTHVARDLANSVSGRRIGYCEHLNLANSRMMDDLSASHSHSIAFGSNF